MIAPGPDHLDTRGSFRRPTLAVRSVITANPAKPTNIKPLALPVAEAIPPKYMITGVASRKSQSEVFMTRRGGRGITNDSVLSPKFKHPSFIFGEETLTQRLHMCK